MSGRVEVLDLFSAAAGGWSLGMHRAGYVTVAACEVEAWRRALYSENNPDAKVYDDVRTLTADRLRADLGRLPTIVVGSPPCQDISSANTKGKGVEGARSGLYFEAVRIIGEVRPRWFALENSANLRTRGYDAVKAALEAIGYTCWPFVVRAGDIGANHDRARAWVLGCDLAQVADADGIGRDEGWSRGWGGFDVPVPSDTGDAAEDGRGPGLSGRRAVAAERLPVEACGDAEHATCIGHEGGRARRHGPHGDGTAPVAGGDGHAANADRDAVRFAVLPGRPQPEAAIVGDADPARQADADAAGERPEGQSWRDVGRQGQEPECADVPSGREMGVCSPDSLSAIRGGADWSLADLADHLRLDDGLSARLAGTRVAVGGPKGTTAASLVVEAFGDAVIPQIPEAIGLAFQRVEASLRAIGLQTQSLAA